MQMGMTYTMVHHTGLNVVPWLKLNAKCQSYYFCNKTYIPHVLLMNLFKQTYTTDLDKIIWIPLIDLYKYLL
jgi:hypothetical protein